MKIICCNFEGGLKSISFLQFQLIEKFRESGIFAALFFFLNRNTEINKHYKVKEYVNTTCEKANIKMFLSESGQDSEILFFVDHRLGSVWDNSFVINNIPHYILHRTNNVLEKFSLVKIDTYIGSGLSDIKNMKNLSIENNIIIGPSWIQSSAHFMLKNVKVLDTESNIIIEIIKFILHKFPSILSWLFIPVFFVGRQIAILSYMLGGVLDFATNLLFSCWPILFGIELVNKQTLLIGLVVNTMFYLQKYGESMKFFADKKNSKENEILGFLYSNFAFDASIIHFVLILILCFVPLFLLSIKPAVLTFGFIMINLWSMKKNFHTRVLFVSTILVHYAVYYREITAGLLYASKNLMI